MPAPILTERFLKALNLAFRVHNGQVRKAGGKNRSYFGTHLMAVCSYVQEVGGNEDEAIAAILHDAVEDQLPAMLRVAMEESDLSMKLDWTGKSEREIVFDWLYVTFDVMGGDKPDGVVAATIRALTDDKLPEGWKNTPKTFKQEWLKESIEKKARKLSEATTSVLLVKACDTLHNMRAVLQERTENGPQLWKSFALGAEGTIWKMERMTEVFEEHGPAIVAIELRKTLTRLKEVAKEDLTLKLSK